MVQYVFTPWRNRQELLLVRQQFYGGQRCEDRRHEAVARVSMWMQRGNCPHMAESTALLMAAVLSDESAATANAGSSTYAVRAAYSAAFSRFVTGLLDGHQDKQRKQSMYSIAKTIGLPATFVELRHQSTHEQLPSLAKLRSAARKALAWIGDYYWKHLAADDDEEGGKAAAAGASTTRDHHPCRELVLAYLREDDEAARRKALELFRQWDRDRVLKTVAELQETLPGNQVFLKCLKLSKELMAMAEDEEEPRPTEETEELSGSAPAAVVAASSVEPEGGASELDTGWSRYSGAWKAKPIGVV